MQKRLFIKQVRDWNASAVGNALKEEPELARYVDDIGKTPLHHCAAMNTLESKHDVASSVATAEALISSGADVNAVRIIIDDGEEFRATPLWYAIAWGKNPALTRFLLKQGARPDDNAVRSAIWDQDLEIANLLLSFGANIDAEIHQQTPLLETVKSKRMKLLGWLVGNGARINFQDDQGYSALHYAVKRNHLKQVAELLQLGADPELKGKDGATPLSLARKLGRQNLQSCLKKFRIELC